MSKKKKKKNPNEVSNPIMVALAKTCMNSIFLCYPKILCLICGWIFLSKDYGFENFEFNGWFLIQFIVE
jgi:hypothetical protein